MLPHVVGQTVADRRGLLIADAGTFADFVATKTLTLFNHNQGFRRQMLHKSQALDYLYMFADHWLDAALKRGEVTTHD